MLKFLNQRQKNSYKADDGRLSKQIKRMCERGEKVTEKKKKSPMNEYLICEVKNEN